MGGWLALWLLLAPLPLDEVRFESWSRQALSLLERAPYFLGRAELLALPVPPPPANSAAATRAELDELLALQARRTRAQDAAIRRHRTGLLAALLEVAQRDLDSAPMTRAFFEHVDRDLTFVVFHAKRRFERARPHQLEPRLRPSIPAPAHASYPSGHALEGHVLGRLLARFFPAFERDLLAAGLALGREREIAGVHYPSDSAASRALGDRLLARLGESPAFQRELAAALTEWRCGP